MEGHSQPGSELNAASDMQAFIPACSSNLWGSELPGGTSCGTDDYLTPIEATVAKSPVEMLLVDPWSADITRCSRGALTALGRPEIDGLNGRSILEFAEGVTPRDWSNIVAELSESPNCRVLIR